MAFDNIPTTREALKGLHLEDAAYAAWQVSEVIGVAADLNEPGPKGMGASAPASDVHDHMERVNAVLLAAGALARELQTRLMRLSDVADQ